MRRGGILLALALAMVAALGVASPARAAVTIGSNLVTDPMENNPGCGIPCTTTNLTLIAASQAPGGLMAPINGVVTSWRVKSGSAGNPVNLRVLRPSVGTTFTGAGTSAAGTTTTGIAGPFSTRLPIKAGDAIGLNNPNAGLVLGVNGGASQVYWNLPPLADGSTRAGLAGASRETMVQAVVEPDADCDGFGDETQDTSVARACLARVLSGFVKGKKLKFRVRCALVTQDCEGNRAVLRTAKRVKLSTATSSAKGKRIKLGKKSFTVPAGATRTVRTTLTKAARKLFQTREKVKAKAVISAGGLTETDTLRVKRKGKKK